DDIETNLNIDLGTVVEAVDEDGDTVALPADTVSINVGDDVPEPQIVVAATQVAVDESVGTDDGLINFADPDDESGETDPFGFGQLVGYSSIAAAMLITATPAAGADGEASSSTILTNSTGGAFSGQDSNLDHVDTGNNILLFTVGGVIVGRDEITDEVVFAFGFDGADLVLAQYSGIVHGDIGNADEPAFLNNIIFATSSVTDGDGDSATATSLTGFNLTFEDDGPELGVFTSGVISNEIGFVNGFFDVDFGTDGVGSITLGGTPPDGLTYTTSDTFDLNGDLISTTLTADNGTTDIFSLTVNVDGTYVFNLIEPGATTEVPIPFSAFSGGGRQEEVTNVDLGVTDQTFVFDGLFFTGADHNAQLFTDPEQGGGQGDGINPNGNGFGVGSSSAVQDDEGFSFSIVDGATGLIFDLAGYTGGPTDIQVSWAAYSETSIADITAGVTVPLATGNFLPGGFTTDPSEVNIDAGVTFNTIVVRLDVFGTATGGARVQDFTVLQTIFPSDVDLDFDVTVTDGDGDSSVTQNLSILIDADNAATNTLTGDTTDDVIAASTIVDAIDGVSGFDYVDYGDDTTGVNVNLDTGLGSGGDAAGDTYANIDGIIGGSGNDTLTGNGDDNHLIGGDGADTLIGNAGEDILAGGLGGDIDTLTGGSDADTFVIDDATAADIITDFEAGIDEIDLTALLTLPAGTDLEGGAGSNFVDYDPTTGVLKIDQGGNADTASGTVVATLSTMPGDETVRILFSDGNGGTDTDTV
ncbi:MAG: DUF5801 repeats-in-toxin domain-containing protein, partial [Rhizobiaceae bacterium]